MAARGLRYAYVGPISGLKYYLNMLANLPAEMQIIPVMVVRDR